jgi:hypothetical protein
VEQRSRESLIYGAVERLSTSRRIDGKPFDSFVETDYLRQFYRKNTRKLMDEPLNSIYIVVNKSIKHIYLFPRFNLYLDFLTV